MHPPPPLLGDSRWNNLSAGHKPVNIRREDPVARSLLRSDSLNHMWNVESINQNCAQTLPCIKNWSWLSPLESVVGCLRSRQCGLLLHGVGKKLLKPTEWIRRRIKHSQTHTSWYMHVCKPQFKITSVVHTIMCLTKTRDPSLIVNNLFKDPFYTCDCVTCQQRKCLSAARLS